MALNRLIIWLAIVLAVFAGFWLMRNLAQKKPAYQNISASELEKALGEGADFQVIDIRDEATFRRGHIPGAINVPFDLLRERIDQIGRDRKVVLVCYSGHTSMMAAEFLVSRGYTNIWNMVGGMAAWRGPLSTR